MEKNRIVPLIYGYLVCVVSIVVFLISLSMIISSSFNLQDPLRVEGYQFGPIGSTNLSSFEGYKIDVLTNRAPQTVGADQKPVETYTPSDTELRAAYDAAKNDKIAAVRLDADRSITTGVILLIVSVLLFWTHWGFVRRFNKVA